MRPWTLRRIATRTLENPRRIPFGFVRRPARSTTTPVGPIMHRWTPPDMTLEELVDAALAEDVGDGDVTAAATVDAVARGRATITQKSPGVISGLAVAEAVFRRLDPEAEIERLGPEGEWREAGAGVLRV